MLVARHVPHEDPHLTVIDLASVTTPLPFHPDRMPAPFRKAAGIESNDAIGLPQLLDYLPNQHAHQRTMIPRGGADEVLHDQALDIDQGRNLLGILACQVEQQPLEVEVDMALTGFSLQSVLIGHHKIAQTIHHEVEHVGGNDAVTQQFFLPFCPRRGHLFASSPWPVDMGMRVGSD
jgi:hypothetical protein